MVFKFFKTFSFSVLVIGSLCTTTACSKKDKEEEKPKEVTQVKEEEKPEAPPSANPNPLWKVDARCFYNGPAGSFDYIGVKDPSIIYSGGKYHLFYTGMDAPANGSWRMGYASATSIAGLETASRSYMNALNAGSYFCAPQAFYFRSKEKWFLIFQSGLGASFSVSNDVSDPLSWTPARGMGFTDGIDFWCISDGTDVYVYYSAQDGTRTIKWRKTSVSNFPYNWSGAQVAVSDSFEAPHVYKNKSDGRFYMMVEDLLDNRYFELWTATKLAGPWTRVAEKWASYHNLSYNADHWTDQVSHGEIIRTGTNELMEIDNINHCDVLIQGAVNGNYSSYAAIPYDLGLMRNY